MTDAEIIAWARKYAAACDVTEGRGSSLAERYRRLADLAEKGAEDWQPIATAPRDVSAILLAGGSCIRVGHWHAQADVPNWWGMTVVTPTHWRPLPVPPGGER